jgi:hypothetical protein
LFSLVPRSSRKPFLCQDPVSLSRSTSPKSRRVARAPSTRRGALRYEFYCLKLAYAPVLYTSFCAHLCIPRNSPATAFSTWERTKVFRLHQAMDYSAPLHTCP